MASASDAVLISMQFAGQGSTRSLRQGSMIHQDCRGSGIAASFTQSKLFLSVAHLLQPICASFPLLTSPAASGHIVSLCWA